MQPEISGPRRIEQAPPTIERSASPESYPQPQSPETHAGINRFEHAERLGSFAERASAMPAPVPMPMPIQAPQSQIVQVADDTAIPAPISANDDDNIEREWVNRAKQIILQTKDDPRAREKAIGALQRDYLEKRYGKKLGATND